MIRRTLWFFVFALMAISCLDQPDCFSLNNNYVGVSFKKLSNGAADTITVADIDVDEAAFAFDFTNPKTGGTLPLNIYKDTTIFHFNDSVTNEVYDLQLGYSSKAQFVSEDCGERFVLSDLRVLSHTFDSVRVSFSTPKANGRTGTNIEIYRCPEPSMVRLRFLSAVTITKIETSYTSIAAPASAVTQLRLPLNTKATQSDFTFTFSEGTSKKLSLTYETAIQQLFHACGNQTVISNLAVLKGPDADSLSSVKVIRTGIQNPNLTNIEITP